MVAAAKQISIGGLEDIAEEEKAIEAEIAWRAEMWSALRMFVVGFVDARTGLRGYDACAYHLNRRWEPEGRPVTAGALNAALKDSERNNFRLEWVFWFATQDADIAALLARKVRPAKTPEERIADLEAELRETLSHKLAEQVLRRAKAR